MINLKSLVGLIIFFSTFSFSQNTLVYKGKIGKYSIKLSIDSTNFETGIVYGKYTYGNKKSFLNLKGELNSPILYFEEFVDTSKTGDWYLELDDDSIIGSWIGGSKKLNIKLNYFSGDKSILSRRTIESLNEKVTTKITGRYEMAYYFINEMWVSDEMLYPEIGFNGGFVEIKKIDENSISFVVEMICGPTYHLAFAEGVAIKEKERYIYKTEEGCEIIFQFNGKKLNIQSNNSMECGFGARAYLDHELLKIQD